MSDPVVLELDDPRWAAFVASRSESTPFHHPAWARLLSDCYGFYGFAFALEEAGELVAGVPLLQLRGATRKTRWVSLPFTDAVVPLGSKPGLSELAVALEGRRTEQRVRSVELRGELDSRGAAARGYSHVLDLRPEPDELLETFSKTRVRQEIARATREGVVVSAADDPADLVETFYGLHLQTRRRLGVPIQPRRFFDLIWERLVSRGLGFVLVARLDGRPIAAAVFLAWNGALVYKFGASDRGARAGGNHAVLWEAILRGRASGMRSLDFGRTDPGNEGLRAFKAGWGTVERPLVYTTIGPASSSQQPGRIESILGFTIRHSPPWICRALGETLYRHAA